MKISAKEFQSIGISPNKALGQNFLTDEAAIERITDLICKLGLPVVEIGSGLGAITVPIAKRGIEITGIEIDRRLVCLLEERLKSYPNASVINADFLKLEIDAWGSSASAEGLVVAGNLPYYITSPICQRIALSQLPIKKLVLMMQREAAERFTARPHDKNYGPLSVIYQYMYDIRTVMQLSPMSYYPRPEVSSVTLEMNSRERATPERLFPLLKAAFAMRRKTLMNNLISVGITKEAVSFALQAMGLPLDVRAEAIDVGGFIKLESLLR